MRKEIAILVAAGKGSRLLPLTKDIPKPLIKVHGIPMIETIIQGLNDRGVATIYVVVGYKKEQFSYLPQRYPNVVLVENTEFSYKNNISSVYAMREIFGKADCFICDADLYIRDQSVFDSEMRTSVFFAKKGIGPCTDWVFKTKEERVTHITIGGNNDYELVGISYWKKEDAAILLEKIHIAYGEKGHEELFWEEVADKYLEEIPVYIHGITGEELKELDTLEELKVFDPSY